MSATGVEDTTRQPGPLVIYGNSDLAVAVVAASLSRGRGIESRLVGGEWEHRFYGRPNAQEGAS